jgi:peptidoglycan hydrolase-like protein with peptidoglycan-binding domain
VIAIRVDAENARGRMKMELMGRDLSPGLRGDDVRRLQTELNQLGFLIPVTETAAGFFGQATLDAVERFQKNHGLPVTGVVDRVVAERINRVLGEAPTKRAIVRGVVRLETGAPAPEVVVRAFHQDLREEVMLGQATTGPQGNYQIQYRADPSVLKGAAGVHLIVRAFNGLGLLLATANIQRHAPSPATADMTIPLAEEARLTEYEALLQSLAPVVGDLPLADWTEDQIEFAAHTAGAKSSSVRMLLEAAKLSGATQLVSPAVFYGLGVVGESLDPNSLLDRDPEALIKIVETAVDRRIIPARLKSNRDAIFRNLEQLRFEGGRTITRTVRGRLATKTEDKPLIDLRVTVLDPRTDPPAVLDQAVTGRDGTFAFVVLDAASAGEAGSRRLTFLVETPEGPEAGRLEKELPAGDVFLELRIDDPTTPSPPLTRIAAELHLELPEGLLPQLEERGIHTLDDLRRAGGFERIDGLPSPTRDMRTLEAMAGLSALGDATSATARLVEAGFASPSSVARAARVNFAGRTHESLGDFGAAKVQIQAKALDLVVRNAITADRLDVRDFGWEPRPPDVVPPDSLADLFPASCNCRVCGSADGPLAYLADLADYAVHNLQSFAPGADTGTPITLEDLSTRFHQPLSDLPVSCEQIEVSVRQVRLAMEALRRFLAANGLPAAGSAEEALLEEGQRRYLEAAYAELLSASGTSPEELRLALADGDPVRRALAERLGIDPDDPVQLESLSLSGSALTEAALERLFGLRDTARDPFTAPEPPELLTRRRARLRAGWRVQDEASGIPLIDPDIIGPEYLRTPVAGDPAFDLWQARSDEIAGNVESLRQARAGAADDSAWLESSFVSVLGVSGADLAALATQRDAGADISEALRGLNLTGPAFGRLLRARRLAALGSVAEPEAAAVINILVQATKRARFEGWREEERVASIALAPDHFVIPRPLEGVPTPASRALPEFRASESTLATWRATLRSRREDDRLLEDAVAAAVDAAEEAHLPQLRDALAQATGQDRNRLSDTLLLDLEMDGGARTTRVGRAIETLQGLLWSVRTGQLSDVHPDLDLVDENFDVAWKWLESYDIWRAAIRVFLYPENILLPSLRSSRSPAFDTVVQRSRALSPLSPANVRSLASDYYTYLRDVASLQIGATCFATTYTEPSGPGRGLAGLRRVIHLFARATTSQTVYWSMFDPNDETSRAQSYWRRLPGLDHVTSIAGAVAHHVSPTRRHLYLFATIEHENGQRLMSTRLNLDGAPGAWDDVPTPMAVKDDATDFKVVVKQSKRANEAPELGLELPRPNGRHDIFRGRLELSGDVLAVTNWQALQLNSPHSLLALTSWGEDGVLILTRIGTQLHAGTSPSTRVITNALQSWHGAICWPGQGNLVYLFWRDATGLHYTALWGNEEPVREPRTFRPTFLDGLDLVAPHTTLSFFDTQEQTLVYQRSGTRPGIFISRIAQTQATGQAMLSRPPTGPLGGGLSILALRRDDGTFNPTDGGVIDPPPPPPPPPPDPPPPVFIRLEERERWRAAPHAPQLLNITAPIAENELQLRRTALATIFRDNLPSGQATRGVLEEAYYFVPMQLALQLQHANHFSAALDWYRTVFDYSAPPGQRKIFDGLRREERLAEVLERSEDWLLDPLSPHEIASTRTNAYTRFTVLSIAGCFLDHADREFTRDTSESVERARLFYDTALELLTPNTPEPEDCTEMIRDLDREISGEIDGGGIGGGGGGSEGGGRPDWGSVWDHIKYLLAQVTATEALRTVQARIREVWRTTDSVPVRLGRIHALATEAQQAADAGPSLGEVLARSEEVVARAHLRLSRTSAFSTAVERVSAAVGLDFGRVVSGVVGIPAAELERDRTIPVPWLRERVRPIDLAPVEGGMVPLGGLTGSLLPDGVPPGGPLFEVMAEAAPLPLATSSQRFAPAYVTAPVFRFCVPPNPEVDTLRRRASLNLYKIRTCRNIAGEIRELEPYPNAEEVLPGESRRGEDANSPAARTFRPTPYRYAVLVDRAKQLVSFAQQTEAAFLGALERRDAEELGLMRARQDLQLARAGVRLQDLRVLEAEGAIRLAETQRHRAGTQADYYAELLGESTFGVGSLLTMGAAAAVAAVSASSLGLGLVAAGASLFGSWSSHSQREEEWERQLATARLDVAIGNRQILIAHDHVQVTEQERNIAALHTEHAATTAEFLANKFTSAELYDWMSRILEEVYRFFLQQATAMASLAESQLAFERQEILPPFVQADYWDARTGLEAAGGVGTDGVLNGGGAADRRGMTGSARLLQDIFQLDQFAFQTDRRRLQLIKILSLAQLGPAEFQRFRETGTLRFDTPLEMFDRDFPGHYLRLVRRVRCTVIALIPPAGGIRATLANGGISRVIVPLGGGFRRITVHRPPESVALTSPREATGLFELSPQPQEFLLPFEGIGVDTAWQLSLPRASNRFDFGTIADVLLTIEYTALDSSDYRAQVIRELDRRIGGDRPFSFRHELADQWYDLNNPERLDPTDRMRVRFQTRREDFPPNLEDLRIQHVTLYFSVSSSTGGGPSFSFEIPVTDLRFTEESGSPSAGGGATTRGRIASTELGNAPAWLPLKGRAPFGTWELALRDAMSDGRDVVEALKNEEITEILLIVSYTAELPAWPE